MLYLAIVGIWAMVLVPRWLRPPHASGTRESNLAEPLDAGMQEDLAGEEDGAEDLPIHGDQVAAAAEAQAGGGRQAGDEPGPSFKPGRQQTDGRTGPVAAERKTYIMKARRRPSATSSTTSTPTPRCVPSAIDGQRRPCCRMGSPTARAGAQVCYADSRSLGL